MTQIVAIEAILIEYDFDLKRKFKVSCVEDNNLNIIQINWTTFHVITDYLGHTQV